MPSIVDQVFYQGEFVRPSTMNLLNANTTRKLETFYPASPAICSGIKCMQDNGSYTLHISSGYVRFLDQVNDLSPTEPMATFAPIAASTVTISNPVGQTKYLVAYLTATAIDGAMVFSATILPNTMSIAEIEATPNPSLYAPLYTVRSYAAQPWVELSSDYLCATNYDPSPIIDLTREQIISDIKTTGTYFIADISLAGYGKGYPPAAVAGTHSAFLDVESLFYSNAHTVTQTLTVMELPLYVGAYPAVYIRYMVGYNNWSDWVLYTLDQDLLRYKLSPNFAGLTVAPSSTSLDRGVAITAGLATIPTVGNASPATAGTCAIKFDKAKVRPEVANFVATISTLSDSQIASLGDIIKALTDGTINASFNTLGAESDITAKLGTICPNTPGASGPFAMEFGWTNTTNRVVGRVNHDSFTTFTLANVSDITGGSTSAKFSTTSVGYSNDANYRLYTHPGGSVISKGAVQYCESQPIGGARQGLFYPAVGRAQIMSANPDGSIHDEVMARKDALGYYGNNYDGTGGGIGSYVNPSNSPLFLIINFTVAGTGTLSVTVNGQTVVNTKITKAGDLGSVSVIIPGLALYTISGTQAINSVYRLS
jgi:hypothetical protein